MHKYSLLLLSFLGLSISTSANTIDLDALMSKNAQPIIDAKRSQCSKGGGALRKLKCKMEYPTNIEFTNISFTAGDVRKSQLNQASFPDEISTNSYFISNCTPIDLNRTENLEITKNDEIKIIKKDSIKTTKSTTTKANLNLTKMVQDVSNSAIGVDLSSSASREVSFENSSEVVDFISRKHSVSISSTIPAWHALLVSKNFRKYRASLDFEGDFYVDGQSANAVKPLTYSGLVGNTLLSVEGTVSAAAHSALSETYVTVPLTQSICQANQITELTDNYIAIKPLAQLPIKETLRFTSYVSLTTADVISNIQIRVRNLGAGLCRASLFSNFGSRDIYVPDNVWSQWETILTPTQRTTFNLSTQHSCSAGFEAEIRYYK